MKDLELRQQYRESNYKCELCGVLKKCGVRLDCNGDYGLECHHICGGAGGRWDQWSNLLMICRPAHEWCHKCPREAKIVSVYAKWKKGELSESEYHAASGMYLVGALEIAFAGVELPGFVELGLEVIDDLTKGE